MLRHVTAPSRAFIKVPHTLVRSHALSSDAKILLMHVCGVHENQLRKPLSEHAADVGIKNGPYKRAKRELVQGGYVRDVKYQAEGGRWVTSQQVTNVPWEFPSDTDRTVGERVGPSLGDSQPLDDNDEMRQTNPPAPEAELEPVEPEVAEPEALPWEERDDGKTERRDLAVAEEVLLSLRYADKTLYLGVREARKLAVVAAEWLRRGISPRELRRVLMSQLPPGGVRSAVGLLGHRLRVKMPPVPATLPPLPALGEVPLLPVQPAEMVECAGGGDRKEHMFRPVGDEDTCGPCRVAIGEKVRRGLGLAPEPRPHEPELPGWRERLDAAGVSVPGLTGG
ncbi:hypothetical protein GCM10010329_49890 [Streptomyces spiroverticillatus]|uniref:Uncharacterized protein n=1 Tax=Streptomyces finlayi TaxID=67296 RepID=A0A918X1F7_9ACTN|nr:hypothetical protein [Streptomyces finlayi]GHA20552.1 hypothetical protein GCM10010329_49890 [Streptomyces spiroverticillatus]GHD03279.1 hypothetical protein GCM10010334_50840 [Streptomyces finlayi]